MINRSETTFQERTRAVACEWCEEKRWYMICSQCLERLFRGFTQSWWLLATMRWLWCKNLPIAVLDKKASIRTQSPIAATFRIARVWNSGGKSGSHKLAQRPYILRNESLLPENHTLHSHYARALTTLVLSSCTSWKCASQPVPVWPLHIKCSIVCRKAKLHKCNKQETNTLTLWDLSRDWQNRT